MPEVADGITVFLSCTVLLVLSCETMFFHICDGFYRLCLQYCQKNKKPLDVFPQTYVNLYVNLVSDGLAPSDPSSYPHAGGAPGWGSTGKR